MSAATQTEVIQADRDRAADWLSSQGSTVASFNVRSGNCEDALGVHPLVRAFAAHRTSSQIELLEALSWFIDDIDGTHTVMVDFDANVERARKAIAKARGLS